MDNPTSIRRLNKNSYRRTAERFKLDENFVLNKMDETERQGVFSIGMLEKSLMDVVGIIKTEEQFIAICTYLAYSTRLGIKIDYAMNTFIKLYRGPIDVKDTMRKLSDIITKHNNKEG